MGRGPTARRTTTHPTARPARHTTNASSPDTINDLTAGNDPTARPDRPTPVTTRPPDARQMSAAGTTPVRPCQPSTQPRTWDEVRSPDTRLRVQQRVSPDTRQTAAALTSATTQLPATTRQPDPTALSDCPTVTTRCTTHARSGHRTRPTLSNHRLTLRPTRDGTSDSASRLTHDRRQQP